MMTFPEFSAALERYGADLSRWPAGLRAEADRLVATDRAAAGRLSEAERLEGLLARAVEPVPIDAALIGRIVAGAGEGGKEPRRFLPRPPGRLAAWAAAAIVALLATGFIAGLVVPADRSEEAFAALIFGGGPPDSAGGLL